MSTIFGIIQPEGHSVEQYQLLDLGRTTERYAPDGIFVRAEGRVGMGFQPYHTHQRSNLESQPAKDLFGNMIVLDGRIDNYKELQDELGIENRDFPDFFVILVAFQKWGERCFSKLVGDWALALWCQHDRSLYLARDHAGTRTLYFTRASGCVRFSTYLETLLARPELQTLDQLYVARYISGLPKDNLTPYQGICSVPARHVLVLKQKELLYSHWDPTACTTISYRADRDYDEHFLALLRKAVQRRIADGRPILADLSGGVDSTSIVCVADIIRRDEHTDGAPLLDTVSFYDDSEPDWNESSYFEAVEVQRNKGGVHVRTIFANQSLRECATDGHRYLVPGVDESTAARETDFNSRFAHQDYRIRLSGIGGDELLGGVPTGLPELADLLLSGQVSKLIRRSIDWCLPTRTPVLHLSADVMRFIIETYTPKTTELYSGPVPWLNFVHTCNVKDDAELKLQASRWSLPSRVNNRKVWDSIPGLLNDPHLYSEIRREYRYPFLDRDLVSFLFGVPREQLVHPGRRRLMMRRALRGIVPDVILERRRKASITRGPLRLLERNNGQIKNLLTNSVSAAYDLIDERVARDAIDNILATGANHSWPAILRTVYLELWLRQMNGMLGPLQNERNSKSSCSIIASNTRSVLTEQRQLQ